MDMEYIYRKTSLKPDREVGGGAHLESLRFHLNLTLAKFYITWNVCQMYIQYVQFVLYSTK
jgi:hypothetical protein